MTATEAAGLGYRSRRLFTVGVALWMLTWLAVGVYAQAQIRELTTVSDSLVQSGEALDTAGAGLETLGRLPLVGEQSRRLGNEVRETAEEVREAAVSSRNTIRSVSLLFAAVLVFVPAIPVVGLYAPFHLAFVRERRSVATALHRDPADPHLARFLAHRALHHLPYDVLRQASSDPWDDLARGSYRALADAELRRLGLARTSSAAPAGPTPAGEAEDGGGARSRSR